ncbi:hypothetical protein Slin15195_G114710 [Septoria linicola]|uniref:Uncharacterized protein n=1 Tax=Septoria linicola TaxID=215465 RepID=A0A9Q9B6A9_9PEZI|nr:hypothetical protein Slin14017_G122690 [Septoria linicola]USW58152.1 hypothetical protein Slin15195_G114710 [Septoria linicola]
MPFTLRHAVLLLACLATLAAAKPRCPEIIDTKIHSPMVGTVISYRRADCSTNNTGTIDTIEVRTRRYIDRVNGCQDLALFNSHYSHDEVSAIRWVLDDPAQREEARAENCAMMVWDNYYCKGEPVTELPTNESSEDFHTQCRALDSPITMRSIAPRCWSPFKHVEPGKRLESPKIECKPR